LFYEEIAIAIASVCNRFGANHEEIIQPNRKWVINRKSNRATFGILLTDTFHQLLSILFSSHKFASSYRVHKDYKKFTAIGAPVSGSAPLIDSSTLISYV
jgi:hypothetical protein